MPSHFYCLLVSGVLLTGSGCAMQEQFVPASELTASQLRAQELFAHNQELEAAHLCDQQMISGLQGEQQTLNQALADSQHQLSTANQRLDNLLAERDELKDQVAGALEQNFDDPITTNYGIAIDGFEYDAVTGLYRFQGDVQFDLGRAVLRPESIPVLKDFVSAVQTSAPDHRILIVGHTDDRRILRGSTAAKHATNWHLSTNRADAVIVELRKLGVDEQRMAAMGYSKFQPLENATDDVARQRNRRVELYLVPNSGQVASQWDPMKSVR